MTDFQNTIASLLGTAPSVPYGYVPPRPTEKWRHEYNASRVQWATVVVLTDDEDGYDDAREAASKLANDAWATDSIDELDCIDSTLINESEIEQWDSDYEGAYDPDTGAPICPGCGDAVEFPQAAHKDGDECYCPSCFEAPE